MQNIVINNVELKKSLPYGAIKEIAYRTKTSIFTVSRVVNQGGKNPKIRKAIKEYLEEIQQVDCQINQLVNGEKASS